MQMYKQRRDKFMSQMNGGVAIFRGQDEIIRNNDAHYKYRPDSDLYYLTGFAEPNCVVVLAPEHPEHKFIMFVRPRDPERETWDGKRAGIEGAMKEYGADIAYSIDELDAKLPLYFKNVSQLYYTFGNIPEYDLKMIDLITNQRRKVRAGEFGPSSIIEQGKILHELRLFKTKDELEDIRRANYISQEAHIAAMKATKAGLYEYEIEALIEHTFKKMGASSVAYNSIVGTGVNATILHYVENNKELKDGELLLIDAGAEYNYYAGDITRTFPVNGKFTPAQKALYEVVLKAEMASIEISKPGIRFLDVHNKAVDVLTEGLIDLGLLKGSKDENIEKGLYKQFYMHKTGHWLGMDVHDVGSYYINGESRLLEPGMMMTIEPGLYVQEGTTNVPEEFIGMGIRIEDDVIITAEGCEVLSERVPKTVADIENLMAG